MKSTIWPLSVSARYKEEIEEFGVDLYPQDIDINIILF